MQSAKTVLGVLRERGRRGLPCEELYRQLFNPQLYLLAYGRIYANHGAMTPGVTSETVDGMSQRKIDRIIEAIRHERYRFKPVRRIHIPKKNGKMRPLELPTWSDKLVGEVIRLLLEAYYEPTFSDHSHGFRPRRGCHTALREVDHTWTGTSWFIEGDIADCFGSLDHRVLLSILGEKIHDQRFLRLVRNMLTAGYLEDWKWGATLSGTPQGGVASPVLSNIYLHKLDEFVETVLIPEYTRGKRRARNPAYLELQNQLAKARRRGDRVSARTLRQRMVSLPSADPGDPAYRRLRYIRYADDHLLGFTGPKAEAEQIKQRLAQFLRDELILELSQEKTLITHARTGAARFLGYEITTQHNDTKKTGRYRRVNGQIALRVPRDVIKAKCAPYLARGNPAKRTALINSSDHAIVATFGTVYRGVVQYYLLAGDVFRLHRLQWVMETAMLKTLAAKHRSSVSKMAAKHKVRVDTPNGPRVCFEARIERKNRKPLVARFGGIPLQRQRAVELAEHLPGQRDARARERVRSVEGDGACRYLQRLAALHTSLVQAAAGSDRYELHRAAEIGRHTLWDAAGLLQNQDTRSASAELIARERLMIQLADQAAQSLKRTHTEDGRPADADQLGWNERPLGPYPPGLEQTARPVSRRTPGTSPLKGFHLMPQTQPDHAVRAADVYLLFAHEPYYLGPGAQEINTTLVAAASLLHPRVRQPDGAQIHDCLTQGRHPGEILPLATLTHELGGGADWPTVGDWESGTTDLLQLVREGECDALSLGLPEIARALICTGPHSHVRTYDAAADQFIAHGPTERAAVLAEVDMFLACLVAEQALWPGDGLLPPLTRHL